MEKNYKEVGYWWNDRNIELIEKDGKVYRLYGWNGYQYNDCWECGGKYYMDVIDENIIIVPIYSEPDENDCCNIVDYEIH